MQSAPEQKIVELPAPALDGDTAVEECLANRRSIRTFADDGLSLRQLSQLLWAAQGVTSPRGFRTAPSAGALYPLELFVAAGSVDGLAAGLYHYRPEGHELKKVSGGDKRKELWRAGLRQTAIRDAPAVFVFGAVFERITGKYGKRGLQYAMIEVGHAAQNLCLQAVSLDLGTVPIGAFDDAAVNHILDQVQDIHPLYLLPVGKPAR